MKRGRNWGLSICRHPKLRTACMAFPIVRTIPRWGLGGGYAEPGGSDDAMTMTITLFSLYIFFWGGAGGGGTTPPHFFQPWLHHCRRPSANQAQTVGKGQKCCLRETRMLWKSWMIVPPTPPALAQAPPCLSTGTWCNRCFSDHSFYGQKLSGS